MSDPSPSIAEFLSAPAERGELQGFRCAQCDFVTAPRSLRCARCGRDGLTAVRRSGRVTAYPAPAVPGGEFLSDTPCVYAAVDLEEGDRITGWMPSMRRVEELATGDRAHFARSPWPGVPFAKDEAVPVSETRS